MTENQPQYGAPAQPLSPAEERQWGMLSHAVPLAAMVLSAGTLGFVASLVLYLLYKDRGAFVRQHCANSLNVQIITGIGLIISVPLMFIGIGFLTYGAVLLFASIVHIVGAIKASNGETWNPPLTPRLVS